jgi:hypothetical protein
VAAPTRAQAAKLTPARLRRLLLKAGRRRHLDRDVERLRQFEAAATAADELAEVREVFTDTYLHQPPVVENAMGIQLCALLPCTRRVISLNLACSPPRTDVRP